MGYRARAIIAGELPEWCAVRLPNTKRRSTQDRLRNSLGGLLFDHWGRLGDRLVLEPYDLDDYKLRRLLAFCRKHNCDASVEARSQHYPGVTVRVLITPIDNGFHAPQDGLGQRL